VDAAGDNPGQLLVRPWTLLLLGPDRVLADSPGIGRITWRHSGQASTYGTGRTRTKICDPWSSVRLLAYRARPCGNATAYMRVRATFRYRSRGRTIRTTHTWSMPTCPIRVR
jgi:hypothetical protein